MDNPKSFTFMEGKTIDLVPLNSEHVKIYTRWFNNPKVRKYLFGDLRYRLPNTLEEIKKWIEPLQEGLKENIHFEIWHKIDKKPLGLIGYAYINWIDRFGVAYIFIGETDNWGHNIAGEATELLFNHAFNEVNLNKINVWIAIDNIPSQNTAKKLGFIFEGTLKQWVYIDGKYVDVKCYRLLKEEWIKRNH